MSLSGRKVRKDKYIYLPIDIKGGSKTYNFQLYMFCLFCFSSHSILEIGIQKNIFYKWVTVKSKQ
jgi:hypothetical protein